MVEDIAYFCDRYSELIRSMRSWDEWSLGIDTSDFLILIFGFRFLYLPYRAFFASWLYITIFYSVLSSCSECSLSKIISKSPRNICLHRCNLIKWKYREFREFRRESYGVSESLSDVSSDKSWERRYIIHILIFLIFIFLITRSDLLFATRDILTTKCLLSIADIVIHTQLSLQFIATRKITSCLVFSVVKNLE